MASVALPRNSRARRWFDSRAKAETVERYSDSTARTTVAPDFANQGMIAEVSR